MEVALYDKDGRPHAYIVGDSTIYLWDGQPVANIDGIHVYGFNGRHLGCFEDGIMYDGQGARIGFTQETCPSVTQVHPVKSVKHVRPVKSVKEIAPVKPVLSTGHSATDLSEFLEYGH